MPVVSHTHISTKCPVCGGRVYPLSRPDDAVECEGDDGRTIWYHADCYDVALKEPDNG